MKVIDRRKGIPLTTTFGDLAVGEAFTDNDGDINIKVGIGCAMYWNEVRWMDRHMNDDTLIVPLEVTYTFEKRGTENEICLSHYER